MGSWNGEESSIHGDLWMALMDMLKLIAAKPQQQKWESNLYILQYNISRTGFINIYSVKGNFMLLFL